MTIPYARSRVTILIQYIPSGAATVDEFAMFEAVAARIPARVALLRRGAAGLCLALVLVAACQQSAQRTEPAAGPTLDSTSLWGQRVAMQHCAPCHVVHLSQSTDERVPMPAVSFYVIAANADWTSDTLRRQLDRLHRRMGIAALDGGERDALAIYILALRNDMALGN